jgi:hypothetical protein
MATRDLVEVPSKSDWAELLGDHFPTVQRSSWYKVVAGPVMGLDMITRNHGDGGILHTKAQYVLNGDRLTYCVGAPGQPRPVLAQSTTTGDGNTRVVLKRVQKK